MDDSLQKGADDVGWANLPLASLPGVPTRVLNWSYRRDVVTLGELVQWAPEEMLKEKNIGRTSIRALERLIARETGHSWAALRVSSAPEASAPVEPYAVPMPSDWDGFGFWLPERFRELSLAEVDLPTRMANFCASHGVETLGALFMWKRQALLETPNMGRKSITDTLTAVREALLTLEELGEEAEAPPEMELEDFGDLTDLVRDQLGQLSGLDRLVLTRRVGFVAPSQTLLEIGEIVGVSRERIRQIQERAIQRLMKRGEIFEKLTAALLERVGEGLVALEVFEDDPYFKPLTDDPSSTRFFLNRFTQDRVRLVPLDGEHFLTALQGDLERAFAAYREALRAAHLPIAAQSLRTHLAATIPADLGTAEPSFWEIASRDVNFDGEGESWRALSIGSTRAAAVLAFVRERGEPVSVQEIDERFGRGSIPDGLIYARRGFAVAPEALEGFDRWASRLVPLCVRHMREEGPERQWTTFELFDALAEEAQLPEWFGPWPLGAMLDASPEVRYLGRGRVALAEAEGFERRLQIREAIVQALEEAGKMLTEDELAERVQATAGAVGGSLSLVLFSAPPVVRWSEGRWGLVERDLPGGAEALEAFGEAIEEELLARGAGMTTHELEFFATRMGAPFDTWPAEALRTAARRHPLLQLNRSGSVGLADWPADKTPTRASVLRRAVEEHSGTLTLDEARRLLERKFGSAPPRSQLALLAQSAGLDVVEGSVSLVPPADSTAMVQSELELELPVPEGVPRLAAPLFGRFLREPIPPLDRLRAEAQQHVRDIEAAHKKNEFIDPEEAYSVVRACERMLEEVERSGDEISLRYVVAALRYFIALDDAESDFSIGGLDDDIAVTEAVAYRLGFSKL